MLKCRPPGNRDPQPIEIESCEPYLFSQVELIEPRVVATLGNFATKLLTGSRVGITRVRGTPQVREIGERTVFLLPAAAPGGGPADAVARRHASRGLRKAPGADRAAPSRGRSERPPSRSSQRARAEPPGGSARPVRLTVERSSSPEETRGDRGAARRRAAAGRRSARQRGARHRQDDVDPRSVPRARRRSSRDLAHVHDRAPVPRARAGLPPRPVPPRRPGRRGPGAPGRLPDPGRDRVRRVAAPRPMRSTSRRRSASS